MSGINRVTGKLITGWAEVEQSLGTILTTEIGERVMRRSFGVADAEIQDRPMNNDNIMDAFIAIAEAIEPRSVNGQQYGEPRFDLVRVVVVKASESGRIKFRCQGLFYPLALSGNYSVYESADFEPFSYGPLA